jgi:hypothetical protein
MATINPEPEMAGCSRYFIVLMEEKMDLIPKAIILQKEYEKEGVTDGNHIFEHAHEFVINECKGKNKKDILSLVPLKEISIEKGKEQFHRFDEATNEFIHNFNIGLKFIQKIIANECPDNWLVNFKKIDKSKFHNHKCQIGFIHPDKKEKRNGDVIGMESYSIGTNCRRTMNFYNYSKKMGIEEYIKK